MKSVLLGSSDYGRICAMKYRNPFVVYGYEGPVACPPPVKTLCRFANMIRKNAKMKKEGLGE